MTRWDHSTTLGEARLLLTTKNGPDWFAFDSPIEICRADRRDEVQRTLQRVEELADQGLHAVGFVAYEAAGAFDSALETHEPRADLPLVWFAIYRDRRPVEGPGEAISTGEVCWHPTLDSSGHRRSVEAIRAAIARGDSYQVNLTFPFVASGVTSPPALFVGLLERQPVPHAGYLDLGRWAVCSVSPELFFRRRGDEVVVRPMKGTAPRAPDSRTDRQRRDQLASSPKDRAENLMIVDMLRNDLGRVAFPGSVTVSGLHRIERYSTVWQMTSTVAARTDASLVDLFSALFPCASITGAPKASSMRIIRELETEPRGVYTGAFGWVGPDRQAEFNVAIRTATVDRQTATATYGVGGGIVWDSRPEPEYSEALVKAKALETSPSRFRLLESLLWRPGKGFWLRRDHLERLLGSADYFGFRSPNMEDLIAALDSAVVGLVRRRHKVRLLVAANGEIAVETLPLGRRRRRPWLLGLAATPVATDDPFLHHKTTERSTYERLRAAAPAEWDDVLLWTENGELTESTVANLVLRIDGTLRTPTLDSGLLPGIYRQHLLRRGEIIEARLDRDDLLRAEQVWLVNSVRGWIRAHFEQGSVGSP